MKPGAYFKQAGNLSINFNFPAGRRGNATQQFEQRRLASSVTADDAEHLATGNVEGETSRTAQISFFSEDVCERREKRLVTASRKWVLRLPCPI